VPVLVPQLQLAKWLAFWNFSLLFGLGIWGYGLAPGKLCLACGANFRGRGDDEATMERALVGMS
jgi:hypothetical protein